MNTIGERIAFLRNKANLTQKQLMTLLEFDNLGKYETNIRTPGVEVILKLSAYFSVTTDWILKGSQQQFQKGEALFSDQKDSSLEACLFQLLQEHHSLFEEKLEQAVILKLANLLLSVLDQRGEAKVQVETLSAEEKTYLGLYQQLTPKDKIRILERIKVYIEESEENPNFLK